MDDPRLTPARPDLAAKYLEGKVEAARFVERRSLRDRRCHRAAARWRRPPTPMLSTQALKGERVTIYDRNGEGWAWGQLDRDGYVGWLPDRRWRGRRPRRPTRSPLIRTFAFPGPSIKLPPVETLVMGIAADRDCASTVLSRSPARAGTCRAAISAIPTASRTDFVAVAERFVGTPYLWGGKSSFGIDCSGLVQVALERRGHRLPARQRHAAGRPRQRARPARNRASYSGAT